MLVLITYDVNTETKEGRRRLRKVSKVCVDYGQRVQNSVFECSISPDQFVNIKKKLTDIISDNDSIRFYFLGKNWERRVETIGQDDSYNPDKEIFII
ncbi:CRISPR-associated endonuclease Cas2 [Macrococcus capreoli]